VPTLSRQNKAKLAALLFWLALIAGYYAIIRRNNLTMEGSMNWSITPAAFCKLAGNHF
jgi:hypothetical protein